MLVVSVIIKCMFSGFVYERLSGGEIVEIKGLGSCVRMRMTSTVVLFLVFGLVVHSIYAVLQL